MAGKKIYAIADGVYSDYRVKALFTDKKVAKAALETHLADEDSSWSDARIEEFYIYDAVPEEASVYEMSCVIRRKNGEVGDERSSSATKLPWNHWNLPKGTKVRVVDAPVYAGLAVRLEVIGRQKKHVQQTYSEQRAMLVAEFQGI